MDIPNTEFDRDAEHAKLVALKERILELAHAADVCVCATLVGREGLAELFVDVDASWSAVKLYPAAGGFALRLSSNHVHYKGDTAAQKRDLENTLGMIRTFAEIMGTNALTWLSAADAFDGMTGATHSPLKEAP